MTRVAGPVRSKRSSRATDFGPKKTWWLAR